VASSKKPAVLKKRQDFLQTYKLGRKLHPCSWLTVNFKETQLGELRVGWTVPRFVGNAVVRNRLKRWCREFLRSEMAGVELSFDSNIVFRRRTSDFYKQLKFEDLRKQLEKAFGKIA